MRKKMRLLKKYNYNALITIFLVIMFLVLIIYILINTKLVNNEVIIKTLMKDTNSYIKYDINSNILDLLFSFEEPLNYRKINKFNYMENNIPIIYIYNTHDKEEYLSDYKEGYDLEPNVYSASSLLRDELNKRGLYTILEDRRVSSDRSKKGISYDKSYSISRDYIIDMMKLYDFRLIIDLHRDAVDREGSYIEYNGNKYAKVLFVIGQKNNNYKDNYELSKKIDININNKVPNISKGIMVKKTSIFNQDLSPNIILLELGSNNNKIDEVYNTIMILVESIKEVLDESKA